MRNSAEASFSEQFVKIPAFMEKGFADLKREVVERGFCSLCGTCAAFCEKIRIEEREGVAGGAEGGVEASMKEPTFCEDYDTVCGMCYTLCPRTFLPLEEIERKIFGRSRSSERENALGVFRKCFALRSSLKHSGQDGGAVTALLAYAIEEHILDCAVVTKSAGENWRVSVDVARDYATLRKSAGTKYTIFPSVLGVRSAIDAGCERIGFVGLPCQIQGLRKVQTTEQPYEVHQEKIKLLIGLFCMENFSESLLDFIDKHVLSLEKVRKFDIKGKEMLVYDESGEKHGIPLAEIERFVGEGCLVCTDFASELADISVGSVGSPEGFSTVIVRSETGEEIVEGAIRKGYVEAKELKEEELKEVEKVARLKKKRRGSREKEIER